jgi:dTDP-4-amino-4,6-dideoxygalactose transaminase
MQSAIGRIQVKRMPLWQKTRHQYAQQIFNACCEYDFIEIPRIPSYIDHAFYKCYVSIKPEKLGKTWTRDKIIQAFSAQDIPCFSGSCSEVYLEKAFDKTSYKPTKSLINAKQLGETSLMFLVHPTLTAEEVKQTCQTIKQIFSDISKEVADTEK